MDIQALSPLVEHFPAGVLVCDADGRVVFENPFVRSILGDSVLELVRTGREDSLHALDSRGRRLAEDEYPLSRALRGEVVAPMELQYVRTDGTRVWVRAAASQVTENGKMTGAIVFFSSLEREKKFEQALAMQKDTLRDQAAALRDADRRKDRFLAALSHELRNPLTAIHGALHVLETRADDPAAVERARGVLSRQVQQIAALVEDLHEISAISEGRITLQKQAVDVHELLTGAVESARPTVERRHQHLTLDLPGDHPRVLGDPVRLTQVITNLLANAAKYTDEGGRIGVRGSIDNGQVVISVRDTGVGIPPDMLTRIFDLFTQVDGHRARSEGGLGIGLTLVQCLVELHGGAVTAHSEGEGRGSEFSIRLPALDAGPQESGVRDQEP